MEENLRPDDIDEEFDPIAELSEGFELGITWRPKYDRPITIHAIEVNDRRIVRGVSDENSPYVVPRIPPPAGDGTFKIGWAIGPDVPVDRMALAIRNRSTGTILVVATIRNVVRGQLWQNTGVKVDAP